MRRTRTVLAVVLLTACALAPAQSPDAPTVAPSAFPPVPAPTTPQPFPPPPPGRPGPPLAPALQVAPAPQPAPGLSPSPAPEFIQLDDDRFSVNFRNMPIEEALTFLSRRNKVNIIVGKGVSGPATVNLYRVTLKEAILNLASAGGFAVEIRNGDYFVLARDPALDAPGASTVVKALKVQYSDTRQVADLLAKYMSARGKITPLLGRKLIVVEDAPAYVERIERLLDQLDVQPKQIMIEARILEITLDENERFGVDWKRIFSASGAAGSVGTSGLALGSAVAPAQGFFFSLLDNKLNFYFNALASAGRVRTLSTPKLLALENQESKVIIGDSTGYRVTTTINLVTSETVQFLESGVILKVIASVDQRGKVLLKIQPEVSTASLQDGVPSKKSIQVTTELICEDGQSIFIGGLIKAKSTTEREGVPILRDLPVLGLLFASNFKAVATAETVVIITPHIVSQPMDLARESDARLHQTEDATGRIFEQQLRLERGRPIP